VVSELFRVHHGAPHGEEFQRACRLLDLDLSPRRVRERPAAEQRVLDKVRKLLNLAESPNPHEAQAAAAAANRLLLRFNLSTGDTREPNAHAFRWIGTPVARVPLEKKLLSGILQDFFFVRCIWVSTREAVSDRPVTVLEVVGRHHNLDIAEYAHDYIEQSLDRLWERYGAELEPEQGRRKARHDYRSGVLIGFREHLQAQQRQERQESGLVWLGDPQLETLLRRRYPHTGRLSGGSVRLGDAHRAGLSHGRELRIRPGVGGSAATSRGRLLT
jgi:hypothetical protein